MPTQHNKNLNNRPAIGSKMASPLVTKIEVDSPLVEQVGDDVISQFHYKRNNIEHKAGGAIKVSTELHDYTFKTRLTPQKTGLMLVGIGGNNGSTLVGAIVANREGMRWQTKTGSQTANYWGSVTQSTTVHAGWDGAAQVFVPFNTILPMVDPNALVVDGWDINGLNLGEAMQRAQVFEPDLRRQLMPFMEKMMPKPSIYYPDFIASNQHSRADNHLGGTKAEHLERIRKDIRDFKKENDLECVVVLWTANTERFADVNAGLNTSATELLAAIERNEMEVAPSHIFAVASILEGAHYINGSPQNSLVPGVVELAAEHGVFVGGDDFKSGQTKVKSILVDFLVSFGHKPEAIVSYNHLGNNDGKNLSEHRQFRSKEITKSSVVDDMVQSNPILYPTAKNPDHCIVIKYVPFVGDSKRAMDEYTSSIFMGGLNTLVLHNTCEDSLLAAPLILDLCLLTELCSRVQYRTPAEEAWHKFHPVLSPLACLMKLPNVPEGTPVCNALFRQLKTLTKLLLVCRGMHSDCDMQLEFFTRLPQAMERAAGRAEEAAEEDVANGVASEVKKLHVKALPKKHIQQQHLQDTGMEQNGYSAGY